MESKNKDHLTPNKSSKLQNKGLKYLQSYNRPNYKLPANSLLNNTRYGQKENANSCHSFLTDVTHVRQMEQSLLQLLKDFHSGKLQAFGQDITFEKMEKVREQQEKLAKLHFELNSQQESPTHDTEEGRRLAKENMSKLIDNLQKLSDSIEQLQSNNSSNLPTFTN